MAVKTYDIEITKSFQEYKDYSYPVIIINSDLIVVYKNSAARFANIKPRVGMHMEKYADAENIKKLRDTLCNQKISIIKLDIQSNIKYCISRFESAASVIVLIFFDSINFIKDTDCATLEKLNDIMEKYSEQEAKLISQIKQARHDTEFSSMAEMAEQLLDLSESDIKNHKVYESDKKILRLREHLRRHMANVYSYSAGQYKSYCDIGSFMRNFSAGISPYISNLGYRINFEIDDNMFMYKLNESDFMTANFILTSIAFEYSVFGKIKVKFCADTWSRNRTIGILRYEFTAPKDFEYNHRNMFIKDYHENIGGIEYLDIALTALIARNNNLKLNVEFNQDKGSNVYIDLIFDSNVELKSAILEYCIDNSNSETAVTAESIESMAGIEFSMMKGLYD